MNRTCLLFFSWCNQCSCSLVNQFHILYCRRTPVVFHTSCMRREVFFFFSNRAVFKWPCLVHITYQGMHSYALRLPEATWNFTCPVRWNLQQQTVWPRGVVSSATESDLFCQITSSDFEVFEPRRLFSVYFLLFLLSLIEPLHHLNLSPNYLLLWSRAGTDVAHDSGSLKGFIKSFFYFSNMPKANNHAAK